MLDRMHSLPRNECHHANPAQTSRPTGHRQGATSGIGLVTARTAARRGARLMLVSRDEKALSSLADELSRDRSDSVAYAVANVGDREQLQAAADNAISRFGGFDTRINNASVALYGRCNGSVVAVQHLRKRKGALINLRSELSDVAIPLQGAYVASKHAVKGFTDALRIELAEEHAPVSVTLVKPAGIDTLFVEHAKSYLDHEPKLPQPVYAPEVVAKAILHAAVHPQRVIYAGGASRGMAWFGRSAPRVYDAITSRLGMKAQLTSEPRRDGDSLYGSGTGLSERSGRHGRVRERSFYTDAHTHPTSARAALMGMAGVLLVAAARRYVRETQGRRLPRFLR